MAGNASDIQSADSKEAIKALGKAAKAADYSIEITKAVSTGDYVPVIGKALHDGAITAITSDAGRGAVEKGIKTTFDAVAKAVPVATVVGQRAGFVAGVVTTGAATLWSAGSEAWAGNYGKAATELAAGTVEAFGNAVPTGVIGAAGREAVRGLVERTVGKDHPDWIPEKSGYRSIGERGLDFVQTARFGNIDCPQSYQSAYPRTTSYAETVSGPCFVGKGIPDMNGQWQKVAAGYDTTIPQPGMTPGMARTVDARMADISRRPGAPTLEM